MRNSLVSVIIPAYHTEKYIRACLNSLLRQTYKNIEFLVSYTASEDRTEEICKDFAARDVRVKVFESTDFGVSNSRNLALSHAKGEYIAFVDADDWVCEDYIEKLVRTMRGGAQINRAADKAAQSSPTQMAVCGFERAKVEKNGYASGKAELLYPEAPANRTVTFDRSQILEQVICNNTVGGYLWNKLFVSDIIREHGLAFKPELCIGEDMVFLAEYIRFTDKARYRNEVLYFYRTNPESALQKMYSTGEIDKEKLASNLKAAELIREIYGTDDDCRNGNDAGDRRIRKSVDYRTVRTSMWVFYQMLRCGCGDPKVLFRLKKAMNGKLTAYLGSRYSRGIEKVAACAILGMPLRSLSMLMGMLKYFG